MGRQHLDHKGFQVGLKPNYTYEEFVAAGQSQFKQLPPAGSSGSRRGAGFDREPEGGVATIMSDEFFNGMIRPGRHVQL